VNTIDALKVLVDGCKCTVHVTINQHRNYYETVQEYIHGNHDFYNLSKGDLDAMIAADTIVEVQFFKLTPNGSVSIAHHDLEAALNQAVSAMENYK